MSSKEVFTNCDAKDEEFRATGTAIMIAGDKKSSSYDADEKEKSEEKESKDEYYTNDYKDTKETMIIIPTVIINEINVKPAVECELLSPLSLHINFSLDKDIVAAYWMIKFLVDSTNKRIVKILGETKPEDYPDGDSDMFFQCPSIDVTGISPSALTNSGLLMAVLIVHGE